MVKLLKLLILAIYEMLPTSPFPTMFDNALANADFLSYLNWFLPFNTCATMMLAWLDCLMVYYVFVFIKKILFDFTISKIIGSGM